MAHLRSFTANTDKKSSPNAEWSVIIFIVQLIKLNTI